MQEGGRMGQGYFQAPALQQRGNLSNPHLECPGALLGAVGQLGGSLRQSSPHAT